MGKNQIGSGGGFPAYTSFWAATSTFPAPMRNLFPAMGPGAKGLF
jgi:hypothetical protein